jgi:hypothetical protein
LSGASQSPTATFVAERSLFVSVGRATSDCF